MRIVARFAIAIPSSERHEAAEGQQEPDGEGAVEARPERLAAAIGWRRAAGHDLAGVGRHGVGAGGGAGRERLGRGVPSLMVTL